MLRDPLLFRRFWLDACGDVFSPVSPWRAAFWVLWNWSWLVELYRDLDSRPD